MTAWGDGWVLMTYLQWRSLEGLARPSKNSCEIRRKNRRGVVEVEGGRRGGFAAAEALRSYGRVCLERAPPSALNRHHHNTQERAGERGREEVLSGPCSHRPDLFLNTKCGRGPEKWVVFVLSSVPWQNAGEPPPPPPPWPLPLTTPPNTHTHTHTGTAHTCRWTSLEGPACLTCSSWLHKYKDSSTQSQTNGVWGWGVLTCTVGVHSA